MIVDAPTEQIIQGALRWLAAQQQANGSWSVGSGRRGEHPIAMTGYVLMALPATLALVLTFINPEHMGVLFKERLGQMMIVGTLVLQATGYVWIRQVVKIEV